MAREVETGEFVEVEGVRLHYVARGEGRPVVLLHGNTGFAHDFSAVLSSLDPREFQAFAFDRPRHGFSERPALDGAMPSQARPIPGALEALGVPRPLVPCPSSGGAPAPSYSPP